MTTSTTRRAVLGLAAAALLPMAAHAQSLPDISGTYLAEGRNPDGSTYVGQAVLAQDGSTVTVAWSVGQQGYKGRGTFDGRVLQVDWGDTHPVIYVLMPGGALHGTWADGRALERLTP